MDGRLSTNTALVSLSARRNCSANAISCRVPTPRCELVGQPRYERHEDNRNRYSYYVPFIARATDMILCRDWNSVTGSLVEDGGLYQAERPPRRVLLYKRFGAESALLVVRAASQTSPRRRTSRQNMRSTSISRMACLGMMRSSSYFSRCELGGLLAVTRSAT